MPFLVVGGVTASVARDTAKRETIEIGERARAFDGTMRSTVRARKYRWSANTTPLTQADADTFIAALNGGLPVACTGDWTGSVDTHPEVTGLDHVGSGSSYRIIVSFALNQA